MKKVLWLVATLETLNWSKIKKRISLEMFAIGLSYFLLFHPYITLGRRGRKVFFVARLVEGALLKETNLRFWKVSTGIWGTQCPWCLIHTWEFLKRLWEISRERKKAWSQEQTELPPTEWTRLWVWFPQTGTLICHQRDRENQPEAILAGTWPKIATWREQGLQSGESVE